MALAFPNPTRSFDPSVNCVRFSGHDRAMEVSFFLEVGALVKLFPDLILRDSAILEAFDQKLKKIQLAATKAYKQSKGKFVCTLSPDDF